MFTFGGVDVVSMSYPLAMSTQASLLSQVEVLFGVEQLIDRALAVAGRREEGTETCDGLCDQLVAIVPRGDAHTPANKQISTVHGGLQPCYTPERWRSTVFFEFGLFGHE